MRREGGQLARGDCRQRRNQVGQVPRGGDSQHAADRPAGEDARPQISGCRHGAEMTGDHGVAIDVIEDGRRDAGYLGGDVVEFHVGNFGAVAVGAQGFAVKGREEPRFDLREVAKLMAFFRPQKKVCCVRSAASFAFFASESPKRKSAV